MEGGERWVLSLSEKEGVVCLGDKLGGAAVIPHLPIRVKHRGPYVL